MPVLSGKRMHRSGAAINKRGAARWLSCEDGLAGARSNRTLWAEKCCDLSAAPILVFAGTTVLRSGADETKRAVRGGGVVRMAVGALGRASSRSYTLLTVLPGKAMRQTLERASTETLSDEAQLREVDERISAVAIAELATYLPRIGEAFSTAFECESPRWAMTVSSDPSDFPVSIGVDASHCDPRRVAEARASGGRSRFYRLLPKILPARLLDLVGFEFKFPDAGTN